MKHIKAAEHAYLCCYLNSEFMLTSVLITVPFFTQNIWGLKLLCTQYPKHCLVAELYPTLCDPMGFRLSGSSVHEISHAIIVEWIAISFSRGSFQPKTRNLGLQHQDQILSCMSHQESPEYSLEGHAEAEAGILWPPDVKTKSLEKTLMLRKTEGRRRRGGE